MESGMKALILPLILACSSAFADNVARVVALRGDVYIENNRVTQGVEIEDNVTIVTMDRSFVVLQFFDGAKVTVRPSSKLIVSQYTEEQVQMNLVQGGLRIVSGAIAKHDPEKYLLETPVALMGVRGTEFSVQLID